MTTKSRLPPRASTWFDQRDGKSVDRFACFAAWRACQKSRDIEKLRTILAEDWQGLGSDGAISSKRDFLNDVKSGASKLESFEMGPMDVKVMGRVAVVQGSDTEKSSTKGKDTSGKWVWTDVFVDRDGKWVAVRSQSSMVK